MPGLPQRQDLSPGHCGPFLHWCFLKVCAGTVTCCKALEDTALTFKDLEPLPCFRCGRCQYLSLTCQQSATVRAVQHLELVRFVRVIGRGGFGIVKMVRAKRTEVRIARFTSSLRCLPLPVKSVSFRARYALKCVRKRDVVEKNMQDALLSELGILKEAVTLAALLFIAGYGLIRRPSEVDHPFIVKFVRSFRNELLGFRDPVA